MIVSTGAASGRRGVHTLAASISGWPEAAGVGHVSPREVLEIAEDVVEGR
ncbi:hypothetical protein K3163_05535 [Qipengyuania sp. 1NDW9]|nr:hypothetical protein [Qipengyuania xiapuensis]MBX7492664.1 hypothetical protein [Qipengyuania xiapuensis]